MNNNENKKDVFKKKRPRLSTNDKKKSEELKDLIERRNKRLDSFFKSLSIEYKIIGDENNPCIIYEDKYVLNCYVHNFELRFTDLPIKGNVIYKVKLVNNVKFDKNKIMSCINDYPKRSIYKVIIKNSFPELYLSGYNFLNKDEKLGRYPVFSTYHPKMYFSKEKANEIKDSLISEGYSVDIV
jgi:hypothetical protein